VFNISDAAITCGVALILLFQRKFFMSNSAEITTEKAEKNQPQA
jgi:lipoprotein signal peptidase